MPVAASAITAACQFSEGIRNLHPVYNAIYHEISRFSPNFMRSTQQQMMQIIRVICYIYLHIVFSFFIHLTAK